jgi:hypothetical protein
MDASLKKIDTRQSPPKSDISAQRDIMDATGVSFGICNQNDT